MENKKDLESEVYESKVRFHTTAMITDNDSGDKSNGMLFVAPLFQVGTRISLKNVKLVTSAVNTCRSQAAITAVDGGICNRKYTLELEEVFNNLLDKLAHLEEDVKLGKNKKYNVKDIESVRQLLIDIEREIGDNAYTIANNIYKSDGVGTDLPATLDRVSSNKVKTWALAFAGYKDIDMYELVKDNQKRNPVSIFFGDSVSTVNGSGLKTLIGSNQRDHINEQFKLKLKNKDFSKELVNDNIECDPGYGYYLCYFFQALLQIVLIDNRKLLTQMDLDIIKLNCDKFLFDLSNPELNVFNDYKPDKIEDQRCPYKFVDFMLNKLLGKELIERLKIDEEGCKCYARGSISISDSISAADHGNQIVAIGFDHNLDNLTYDNSLFIGQGGFVYAPLYNAYGNMDGDLKQKLKLLAFELKTKKIQLDQSGYTTSNEYKFGRIQEVDYEWKFDPGTRKKVKDKIKNIKYNIPDDYDTDISAEDLMELVLKSQTVEKELNEEANSVISNFNKDTNQDENEKAKLFLDTLIKFQKAGMLLNDDQIKLVIENINILKAIFNVVNSNDCKPEYKNIYSWLISNHENVAKSIDLNFLKLDLLNINTVHVLFTRKMEKREEDFTNKDAAELLLKLWELNMFSERLLTDKWGNVGIIDVSIIKEMFQQNKKYTNQILLTFLEQFSNTIIKYLGLNNDNLSEDVVNAIFYKEHGNLTEQISKIDYSKLNAVSIKILFENHLSCVAQGDVSTFSNIALDELDSLKLIELLKWNSDLDFSKHVNWLKSLYLDDLYRIPTYNNVKSSIICFVGKHMECFSREQILSLGKYVFSRVPSTNMARNAACLVLTKLKEFEDSGTKLEKNIVKMMDIDISSYYDKQDPKQIAVMLAFIFEKSKDEQKELLSYLIEHSDIFAYNLDPIFRCVRFGEDHIKNLFSIYKDSSNNNADNDKKREKLDINGFGKCLRDVREMLEDVLKEDKNPDDTSKGKNINYLCLPRLNYAVNFILESQELANLLSDKQIQNINIASKTMSLSWTNLYYILDRFGNKLQYKQFHDLVSGFNKTETCLSNYPNKDDDTSSGFLAKIAFISNFINEKEKEFQEKYSKINDEFEENKFQVDNLICKVGTLIYSNNCREQQDYCTRRHNREIYENSNDAENVHNDLKVGKDDEKILYELGSLNNKLNDEIKELVGKADKMKGLDKIVATIKEETKKLNQSEVKIEELCQKLGEIKELGEPVARIKELNEKAVKVEKLDEIVATIKKSDEYNKLFRDFNEKLDFIKFKMKKFDQLYYGRKNEFFKLKTNFLVALGNLDTGKVSILFKKMYSNYMNNYSDNNKLKTSLKSFKSSMNKRLWQLDSMVIKTKDGDKEYTFNEFFMDGFIKSSLEKNPSKGSNFSLQQKQSIGIINVVNKTEEKDEKNAKNTKVTKVEQYTPEYILENLPLVLEQFHCDDCQLEGEMKEVNLFDLTLKFDQNNKKSLKRFIDSEKLKLIPSGQALNNADQRRNERTNDENHRYFKAVKKLFCNKADHIVENADLVFETDNPNGNMGDYKVSSIHEEFHYELQVLTQKNVEGKTIYLSKEAVIENLAAMKEDKDEERRYEHFLFFCGDWICHSNKFLSQDVSLKGHTEIIQKRIGFGCQYKSESNVLKLNDEVYSLLTAVTLVSGLGTAGQLQNMDGTAIDEICFLITGKKENFSLDDVRFIIKVIKLCSDSWKSMSACDFAKSIVKRLIKSKSQDYEHVFVFVRAFYLEYPKEELALFAKCVDDKAKEFELQKPGYILKNLSFIREQFYYNDYELAIPNVVLETIMCNLTLKFDQNNKKSLEHLIYNKKLKLIEDASGDDVARQRRNTKININGENDKYFKAVKKLFCNKADHIVENADLVFETDNPNGNMGDYEVSSIHEEFHCELQVLTQKNVEGETIYLSKEAVIENLAEMKEDKDDKRRYEHFLFFCGDWICHSNKFLSQESFLKKFENIVKKRIGFGCQHKSESNVLKLNDEVYSLLTAVTLMSGLRTANKLENIDKTVIDEICFLITGKKEDFSLDDAQLIMKATKALDRSVAKSIVNNVIKNQDYKYVFTFIQAFNSAYEATPDEKVEFIEFIGNRDKEIDLMSVISDIDKFDFYPDDGGKRLHYVERRLSFEFMQKLMKQLLEKYEFGVFPNAQQKETLGKFLNKFIVDNNKFQDKENEISNFFITLMKKVQPEKSKEVTKEIIKICSNLREVNQRATILKSILNVSNNSLKCLELLEVLEQYNYTNSPITPIKVDGDLIKKLISDIINKPLPLTKKEVQRLEWFCANIKPNRQILLNEDQNAKFFLDLIEKMPKGSMSTSMFKNLADRFFPNLFEKKDNNFNYNFKFELKIKCMNDIFSCLAYVLPYGKLKNITGLIDSRGGSDYCDFKGWKYNWINSYNCKIDDNVTDEYQQVAQKQQEPWDDFVAFLREKTHSFCYNEYRDSNKLMVNKFGKKQENENKAQKEEEERLKKEEAQNNDVTVTNNIKGEIKNEGKLNSNNQKEKGQKNSADIINNDIIIINNNSNSDNPYTLSAWLGILLPIVPAIILIVKINQLVKINQQKFTVGYIVLIIVGLIPVISAIVFGIMAYKYNQNNLASETQENLKDTGGMDKNNTNKDKNAINQEMQINPLSPVIGSKRSQKFEDEKTKEES